MNISIVRDFLLEFIKYPRIVGSCIPSSKFLINKMLKSINFNENLTIIELGSGTGNFTVELLQRMNNQSKLLAFEINAEFLKTMYQITDPRLQVINDSAENISKYLKKEKADVVISELPFGAFNSDLVQKILLNIKNNLKKNGQYIQFQYFLSNKKDIKNVFGNYKLEYELFNFPPAFIYNCIKL